MVISNQRRQWPRASGEWYVEPPSATEVLLRAERFPGRVHDPACGQGNIVNAAIAAGYEATGSDIVRRTDAAWFTGESDFLSPDADPIVGSIICNPPFYRAEGTELFIRKALEHSRAKVAMFTDIRFMAGGRRANGIFRELPPHRIWIVTPRVSCPPGEYLAAGNKAGNGSSDWCWMVWSNCCPYKGTSIGWLRRDEAQDNGGEGDEALHGGD